MATVVATRAVWSLAPELFIFFPSWKTRVAKADPAKRQAGVTFSLADYSVIWRGNIWV